ncbi:MAG: NAD(+)/NADH kinase, partial [Verrucomicrobia bacterium]|nr:NAD(+)/NADH kinase [Verrucomicrobiota bacterium]
MKKLSRVGIIANLEKKESPEIVQQVLTLASCHGWDCLSETATAACGLPDTVNVLQNPETLAHEVDLLLVIGGDGTMLRVARRVAGLGVPLLGIKTGRLGFLTQITSGEIDTAFAKLETGEFDLEERSLLAGSGKIGSEN